MGKTTDSLLALDRYFKTYEKITPDFVARRQMYGSHGYYIANVAYNEASPPPTLTVRNLSDTPVAARTVTEET